MDQNDNIIIFSVCDNHYAILLAGLLKSIEVNHKSNEKIDFYIIEDNISSDNKAKLNSSVADPRLSLKWIKIADLVPRGTKLPLDQSSFPLNIYARLFIPGFVPKHLKKLLYMDVDMIVLNDISILWKTELKEKIIAATVDRPEVVSNSWGGIANYKELGLNPESKYFNSGLLLIDPRRWRENNITGKILSVVRTNVQYANYPDQYGLNVVFANDWVELDPNWNCHASSAVEKPHVIHFSGRKPFYRSYRQNMAYSALFEKYIALTPWRGYSKVGETKRLLKKVYNKLEKYVSLNF